MQKAPLQFAKTGAHQNHEINSSVVVNALSRLIEDWLADSQIRQHSPHTIQLRRTLCGRLQWFLQDREAVECSRTELRQFFAYLSTGHEDAWGRWGKGRQQQWTGALRPSTISSYYHHLRAFFSWLVGEEFLDVSPMEKLAPPLMQEKPREVAIESLHHAVYAIAVGLVFDALNTDKHRN